MSNINSNDIMRKGIKYLASGLGILLLSSVIAVSQLSTPAFSDPTPAEEVQDLTKKINEMDVSKRVKKVLTKPLDTTHEVLTDDTVENDGAACILLAIFVHLVNLYELTGKLGEGDANDLKTSAEDIMNMLDCSSVL